jgi:hypothetical protein
MAAVTGELHEQLVARCQELQTMGFKGDELKLILEAEFTFALTYPEFQKIVQDAKARQQHFELDTRATHEGYNQTLRRMDYIQSILLSVFQNMVKNYNAASHGQVEHEPDPETGEVYPVTAVKPMDLANMGEKILKIDQERVAAMLSYPKLLESARAIAQLEDTPANPKLQDHIEGLYDDIDEAAFDDVG